VSASFSPRTTFWEFPKERRVQHGACSPGWGVLSQKARLIFRNSAEFFAGTQAAWPSSDLIARGGVHDRRFAGDVSRDAATRRALEPGGRRGGAAEQRLA